MAQYNGKVGTVTLNGKMVGGLGDWSLDTTEGTDAEPAFAMPSFKDMKGSFHGTFEGAFPYAAFRDTLLLSCKMTLPFLGREFEFEGMCNEEKTRVYLESRVYPGKYFLRHIVDGDKAVRHERVTLDLNDAVKWVLFGL